jgi:tetratricopeptide (TPR) repeat protein
MTPYTRSILKFLTISFILGLITPVAALATKLLNLHPAYGVAAGLLLVAGLIASLAYAYHNAMGELRDLAGFYHPVRRLKHDAKKNFESLGVKLGAKGYLDYYLVRSDDDAIRNKLKEKKGVLIVGAPLSGKTRAGVEAIFDTLPRAFLLRTDPKRFTIERIEKLIIPCWLVLFRKPDVVLFFDNIQTVDLNLIDTLIDRLADQTSSIYIVSTCDSGSVERQVQSRQQGPRRSYFEPLYLKALSKKESDEIYVEVWKDTGGPLLSDYSLPGYIVLGDNPVIEKVRRLSEADKKVIQALRLAAACGVLACDEKLFWGILEDVLDSGPQDRPTILERFIEQGMILVQNPRGSAKRILIKHTSYLDRAYDDLSRFKEDLVRLAGWLFEKGDAERMAALGNHYWNVLSDLPSARKVYEQLDKLKIPESSYLLTLAALYAAIGEPKRETEAFNRALALSSKPVEQAQTLISHGDSLLYRLARPADAIVYYNRAYELIGESGDAKTLELIRRRSGDCLLVNRQYSEAEQFLRQWLAGAKADDLLDASERLALSLVGQGKNEEADKTLRDVWSGLPRDKRIERAVLLLDNSEACLTDDEHVKTVSQLSFDCFVAGAHAGPDLKTQSEEIILFGYHVLSSGFLLPSQLAHTYLIASSETKLEREDQSAIRINLGLTEYLFGHVEAARKAYEQALSIASETPRIDRLVAGAEAGLGDGDLLVGAVKEASGHYERALHLAKKSEDANMVNWAHLGLAEVAVAEKKYEEAEEHLLMLDIFINSYQQYMRIWLGMARVKIHFERWEEAESFLARGLSLRKRHDFALRREEFRKEYDSLPKAMGMKGSVENGT